MSTSPSLRVAAVQIASSTDPDANRAALADLVPTGTDLVVLPEAFARDFGKPGSDVSAFAESTSGAFATELERVAAARGTTVVAGMFETSEDAERPANTLLARGRARAAYRKAHLYDSFGYRESDRLTAGEPAATVVDIGGITVGLMTCYDLRFPEFARLLVDAGAQVLVVPAAWVAGPRKVDHWRTLVRARAIENTVAVIAVGQPAPRYCGHSMIVGPRGEILAEGTDGNWGPETLRATIDLEDVAAARRENPSLANRRISVGGSLPPS